MRGGGLIIILIDIIIFNTHKFCRKTYPLCDNTGQNPAKYLIMLPCFRRYEVFGGQERVSIAK